MAGTAVMPATVWLLALLIHNVLSDYEFDYYPEPHYELELLSGPHPGDIDTDPDLDHHHDHDYDHYPEPSQDHEASLPPSLDDHHPDQVQDRWERRLGGTVEGGYTVLEADGTVHHVTYTRRKPPVPGAAPAS